MAEKDPMWLDTVTLDDVELRYGSGFALAANGSLRARAGVRAGGGLGVSAGAGLSVVVAQGAVVIQGEEDPNDQGAYICTNDGAVTKALATADASNPRLDLVGARLLDQRYSGAFRTWQLEVVTGTPAVTPVLPDPLAVGNPSWVSLYSVAVAAGAGAPGAMVDLRPWTVALGGVLPVRDPTDRATLLPYTGQLISRLDIGTLERWTGSLWRVLATSDDAASPSQSFGTIGGFTGTAALWVVNRHASLRWLYTYSGGGLAGANVANVMDAQIQAQWRPPGQWDCLSTAGEGKATRATVTTDGKLALSNVTVATGDVVHGTATWPV